MIITTHEVDVAGIGPVEVTVTERGQGRPYLLLHGGAGPQSVTGFADLLAGSAPARVLPPVHPATLPPERQEVMAGNRAALARYGGASMTDPSLRVRLGGVRVPTLVLWGESDGIAGPEYGRAFAAAIPGARFQLLTATGHV